ncbi:glycosyltransferase [Mucilaginibacter celer]|uniref:Glycosyltransferase n=1 Tax=Mucilaginibacter celer TaxID=2305508 RepID=A0A494VS17_9SPHI|nr:glycosyltransferase [Mucilaginibacter celer]AYL97249.1 glycosyltransferase [Mucilaginibacter celer]
MLNIYTHSHFIADAFGHGGNKRSAQIAYLLNQAGVTANQADLNYAVAKGSKLSHYLTGLKKNPAPGAGHKSKYAIGRYTAVIEQFIKEKKPQLFIWESTVAYNLLLAEIFHRYGIPVIALPHNLESMVAGNKSVFSNKPSPKWLFEELDYLKLCKKVFTISRGEHWLLASYGINAAYLPYYPDLAAEAFLSEIRKKRSLAISEAKKDEQSILLLGTFHNQPTLTGYTELLQKIETIKDLNIHVAGFGSEMLKDKFKAKNIRVWGSVDNDTLAQLITNSDCAVIHQQPSGGALTRIPELLIAGLPVIANTHAARSCDLSTGIIIYDSFDELITILSSGNFNQPPHLNRPYEEQAFTAYIKTLTTAL